MLERLRRAPQALPEGSPQHRPLRSAATRHLPDVAGAAPAASLRGSVCVCVGGARQAPRPASFPLRNTGLARAPGRDPPPLPSRACAALPAGGRGLCGGSRPAPLPPASPCVARGGRAGRLSRLASPPFALALSRSLSRARAAVGRGGACVRVRARARGAVRRLPGSPRRSRRSAGGRAGGPGPAAGAWRACWRTRCAPSST